MFDDAICIPSSCACKPQYSFAKSGGLPSFITLNSDLRKITVAPSGPKDVGFYDL